MPFDPTLPADGAEIIAVELRAQFTALAAQIAALAVPGQATVGAASIGQSGNETIGGLTAAGATGFDIFLKGPGEAGFAVVAMVAQNFYEFDPLPPGSYAMRVAGRNAVGAGVWSDEVPFTIA